MQNEYKQSAIYLQAEYNPISDIANLQTHQIYRHPKINIRSLQLGPIPTGHLRVQMIYAGICGTDIHIATADPKTGYVQSSAPANLDGNGRILGHEGVGKVLDVADDVTHFSKGQVVAFESIQTCGYCEPCRSGKLNQCSHSKLIGMEIDGLFGDIVDLPARLAFDVSKFKDSQGGIMAAACLEPAGVAYLACLNARMKPGERVAVLGAGPIGLLTVMLCKLAFGASTVCLVEPLDFRREFANQWADICLTPDQFMENSHQFEVIIDAAGDLELVAKALNKMSAGGRIGLLARNGQTLTLDKIDLLITRNISIFGSRGHLGGLYEQLARLYLSGRLPMHLVITKLIHGLDELSQHIIHPQTVVQDNCKVMCQLDKK
jgi:(R,R)-butanediol dehydrogenase/meso-butanediol dehydrogenase/diacetyl reductase